jgi:ArsR family transcriptional regulator
LADLNVVDAVAMETQPPPSCFDMNLLAPPPEPLTDERLALLARAVGNPTRLQIVRYLSQCRSHIANDIVEETGLAQSTISEHIRALRDIGIVVVVEDPPRTWYCVNRAVLAQLVKGLAQLPKPFEQVEAPVSARRA